VDQAIAAAARDGGAPLGLSRLNLVGQGRAGKTALARALSGEGFKDTASTVGVEQRLMEVTPAALDVVGVAGVWRRAQSGDSTGAIMISAAVAAAQQAARKLARGQLPTALGAAGADGEISELLEGMDGGGRDGAGALAGGEPPSPREPRPPPQREPLAAPTGTGGGGPHAAGRGRVDDDGPARQPDVALSAMDRELVLKLARDEDAGKIVGLRLSLWDYGGQKVFYALHHLYLTRFAAYVVIFNMEWLAAEGPARDEALGFLRFWLGSIVVHARSRRDASLPPIALVGTHKDKVQRPHDHQAISELLRRTFAGHVAWGAVLSFAKAALPTGTGLLHFFPVDNTATPGSDPSVGHLRAALTTAVSEEAYVHRRVPYTWLQVLEELRSGGRGSATTLAAVVEMVARRGMGERDALLMLRLFNELGLVMHHSEPALRHLVVLDPATFFIHPASLVVCQHNYHELQEHVRARSAMLYDYNRLGDQGLARRRLLRLLWSGGPARQQDLEQLMVRHGLIFPLLSAADGGSDLPQEQEDFLVPAVLPRSAADSGGEAMLCGVAIPVARAVVVFAEGAVMDEWRRRGHLRAEEAAERGFMPHGLFAQVMGRMVVECQGIYDSQVEDLDLRADWIRGALGRLGFALRELTEHGVIELLVTASNPRPVAKAVLRMVGQAVAHMMPSLHFALAVPSHGGGRWLGGAKLHDADADGKRELVILDGTRGLEARLAQAGSGDVLVGRSRMPGAEVQQRFELWLSSAGQIEFYHAAVLCRPSERMDFQLASAVAGRLADTVVGLLGMRVFLDDQQHDDDASASANVLRALATSRVAVVFLSWGALQPLSALQAGSSVDNLLLQLILLLELLATQRLRHCIPIFLSQEESPAESRLGKGDAEHRLKLWVQRLPPVVCSAAVEAAAQALRAAELQPSKRLRTRTVQGSVEEILQLQVEWATVPDHVHAAEKRERELALAWTRRVLACVDDGSAEIQGTGNVRDGGTLLEQGVFFSTTSRSSSVDMSASSSTRPRLDPAA